MKKQLQWCLCNFIFDYNSQDVLDKEDIDEISHIFIETKKRSGKKLQQDVAEYNNIMNDSMSLFW